MSLRTHPRWWPVDFVMCQCIIFFVFTTLSFLHIQRHLNYSLKVFVSLRVGQETSVVAATANWILRFFPNRWEETNRSNCQFEVEDKDDAGALLTGPRVSRPLGQIRWRSDASSAPRVSIWPWVLSTLISGATTLILLFVLFQRYSCNNSFRKGFKTDLGTFNTDNDLSFFFC